MGMEFNITLQHLVQSLNDERPGHLAHQKMLPDGRSLLPPENLQETRQSAVLLLFFEEDSQLKLCLTKRNSKLKHHPGQISFPGGECHKEELDTALTALRETEEETGILQDKIKLLGKLSTIYVSVSNFNIQPYVGFHNGTPRFSANPLEVEEVIVVPLDDLFNPENFQYREIQTSIGDLIVPCYILGNHLVWGATAMIIAELEWLLRKQVHRQEAG
jgi:8-oxo-dGTP pyrophosphatase MutT (NUDIX family)